MGGGSEWGAEPTACGIKMVETDQNSTALIQCSVELNQFFLRKASFN